MSIHRVNIPYKDVNGLQGRFLYAVGGYHSTDSGCPAWGTSNPCDIRFIGDKFGELRIDYEDGETDLIPLILGYTLWLHSVWCERPAPFFGDGKDDRLTDILQSTLSLYGAFDLKDKWLLKTALRDKAVVSVKVISDPGKNIDLPVLSVYTVPWGTVEDQQMKKGEPVFTEAYIADGEELPEFAEVSDAAVFFASHTIDPANIPYRQIEDNLKTICRALHTFDDDFESVPEFMTPDGFHPFCVSFSSSPLAEIASAAVYHNLRNLCERTDGDGFIHTSYHNAPSWRYDGFGPYVLNANSYYDSYYSRDCARAIMTLGSFGYTDKAAASCNLANVFMMTYENDGVTLGGIPVPGHFSVIANKPYIYSRLLIHHGWPTRYTPDRFGDECTNLGNQETDGHGLMMMANYLTWKNRGRSCQYVRDNWKYISECVNWIIWCFDHPELSFAENGLLYGETEAAMNDYTLYANVPCYLGLSGYIEMALAAGMDSYAAVWRTYADRIRKGIDDQLTEGNGWKLEKCGFSHDPVITMLSDIYGFDTDDMPADWVGRCRESFDKDLEKTVDHGPYGVRGGIGYDHSMITQNALLLDRTKDAGKLLRSLCRICYAPRLPEPYLVPEGMSIDAEKGIFRRQGDLGNLVQLAEAMKCFYIVIGISPLCSDSVKIMPRLPEGWSVSVKDFPIANTEALADMDTAYPSGSKQSMLLHLSGIIPAKTIRIRFGPFAPDEKTAEISLNSISYVLPTKQSGDAAWSWLELKADEFFQ